MTDCGGTCTYVARKEDPSNWHGEKPDDWVLDENQPVGLEQKTWECPHDVLSDREYCAFHTQPGDLPADIDEGELFVNVVNESSANDKKMARRKKEFIGATFGPFDIKNATLDAGDNHPIRFNHVTFTAGIRAERAVFEHGIFATAASFETSHQDISNEVKEDFLFTKAKFNSDDGLSFDYAKFIGDGDLSFDYAKFSGNGDLSFKSTEFTGDGDLSFVHTKFIGDGDLLFDYVKFIGDGDLSFDYAKFIGDGDLSFWNGEFMGDGNLLFTALEFSGDGDLLFNSAEFRGGGYLSFNSAEFTGDGDLSFFCVEFTGDGNIPFGSAEFTGDGDLSFVNAEFTGDGDLSFWNAEFTGDGNLSFERAKFIGDGDLSLESVDISRKCSFINTRFSTSKRVIFSEAKIRESLTFEMVSFTSETELEETREFRVKFDFSDAVISDELRFRSSGHSIARKPSENKNNEQARFDLVFTEAVDFSGATFEQPADFSSTQFRAEADFSHAQVKNADFQNADLAGPESTSPANFYNADLSGGNFSNALLTGVSFERAVLNRAELLGADLTRTKLYGALLGDARFNRKTRFWLSPDSSDRVSDSPLLPVRVIRAVKAGLRRVSRRDGSEPYCVYDPRYRGANGETNLEKAAEVYGSLETLARQQSQPELASDCFLGRKDIQLKQYRKDRNWLMIARSMVPNLVARYGESPLRVLGTAAVTISVCGLAYYSFNLIEHTGTEQPATLFESFYFSALTFTTLGYGDFNPITTGGQVLAVAETSVGVILLAILVFVFGRRATR
jgi:uncharacterized protein YjbI with pentapeptide repeats